MVGDVGAGVVELWMVGSAKRYSMVVTSVVRSTAMRKHAGWGGANMLGPCGAGCVERWGRQVPASALPARRNQRPAQLALTGLRAVELTEARTDLRLTRKPGRSQRRRGD